MMFAPIVLLFVAVAGIVILIALLSAAAERKRSEELALLAKSTGFEFFPESLRGFHERFMPFAPFDEGEDRRSKNLMFGERDGNAWYCFDYQYTIVTTSGKRGTQRQTYHCGVVAVRYAWTAPYLRLGPESVFAGVASLFGVRDIQFESDEFNRTFNVQCDNKKFAYDLIHPQMMEYLLSLPAYDWQFGPMAALIVTSGKPQPTDILERIRALDGFLKRIPEFVRQDFGFAPKWKTPLD